MKRLVDEQFNPDSPEHFLAELVRATPPTLGLEAGPPPAFARRRIERAGMRLGRTVTIALVTSGVALAAVGVGRLASIGARPSRISAAPPGAIAAQASSVAPAPRASVEALPEAVSPEAASAQAPLRAPVEQDPVSSRVNHASAAGRPAEGEDPQLVLEAIRSLRHSGDPSRAGHLLADYLRQHPHGVLVEDAIALSIEAALARHDARAAAELSHRYLRQFPHGRYVAYALQSAP